MQSSQRQHTAGFQVSCFLNSKRPFKLKSVKKILNGNTRSILRYIADVLDMEFYRSGKTICKLSHSQIAKYSGCSLSTVKRSVANLVKYRMIKLSYNHFGMSNNYSLGRWILVHVELGGTQFTMNHLPPKKRDTSLTVNQGVGHSEPGGSSPWTTSNNASKNVYNKKLTSSLSLKQHQKQESEQDRKDREHFDQQLREHERLKELDKAECKTSHMHIKEILTKLKGKRMNGHGEVPDKGISPGIGAKAVRNG